VAGLKTTWGRIPAGGVRPLAPSLDTVGPMAADVAGLVLGMRLLEPGFGAGQLDAPELDAPRVGRLGVPAAPEIEDAVTGALRAAGWQATDVDPAEWLTATRWASTLLVAEAYRSNRQLFESHAAQLSADVAPRLDAGRQVTPETLAGAVQAREHWRTALTALFERYDLLVVPTLLIAPPKLTEADQLLTARCTLPVSLAGVPALALPIPARGPRPASLQLISSWNSEELLLAAGARVEAAVAP
jgi:amidase